MSKRIMRRKLLENKHRIARITKKRLAVLMICLLAALAFFIFKVGQDYWPSWMIEIRKGVIAIAGILTVLLILMSPIIVATESDPRPLSGPGKDPRFSVFNSWREKD